MTSKGLWMLFLKSLLCPWQICDHSWFRDVPMGKPSFRLSEPKKTKTSFSHGWLADLTGNGKLREAPNNFSHRDFGSL